MVWLREVRRKGQTVWEEVAPEQCAAGHRTIRPSYGPCPVLECGLPVRLWSCGTEGCEAPVQVDDEHEHRARP